MVWLKVFVALWGTWNCCTQMFLSFVQHNNLEWMLIFVSWFDIGISIEGPKSIKSMSFENWLFEISFNFPRKNNFNMGHIWQYEIWKGELWIKSAPCRTCIFYGHIVGFLVPVCGPRTRGKLKALYMLLVHLTPEWILCAMKFGWIKHQPTRGRISLDPLTPPPLTTQCDMSSKSNIHTSSKAKQF